jgi:exonuclease SbcC
VAAAELHAPDVKALEATATAAANADAAAQKELTRARDRRDTLATLNEQLTTRLDAARPTAEHLALVRGLAELADGKGANRLKMRLSSYVLAARLEEVAAAASIRLSRMSAGRYELQHATEGATRRGRAGLDLRVVDAWTGEARAPVTLSGGETFLASLALALGLADVVEAEAGGARLETLFVDEGFGSLDDEGTLDEVLDVLDGLRDSGRVVGVVSHVGAMRERIPGRLRIEKTRQGSRVRQTLAA